MNFLTCLSSITDTIGGWFAGAAWFQAVKWPFWFCLILIALGGVYTARFQKNTLLCRGITGALKLALIYMFCIAFRQIFPECMKFVPNLPFITITDETLTLIHPRSLFSHPFTALPQTLVKLFFLQLLINCGGHLDYGGKGKLPWFGSQIASCSIAMLAYDKLGDLFNFGINLLTEKFSSFATLFYIAVFLVVLVPLLVLVALKFIFIIFRKSGNPTYTKVMQFLSDKHFGSLPFVTFFSMLFILIFLVVINIWDMAEMTIADFCPFAYILIMLMCCATLLVYSMYYSERKWG